MSKINMGSCNRLKQSLNMRNRPSQTPIVTLLLIKWILLYRSSPLDVWNGSSNGKGNIIEQKSPQKTLKLSIFDQKVYITSKFIKDIPFPFCSKFPSMRKQWNWNWNSNVTSVSCLEGWFYFLYLITELQKMSIKSLRQHKTTK